jgi:meiotic recombination protein REC8
MALQLFGVFHHVLLPYDLSLAHQSHRLVATLGQKSTLRKVTRKAILEVDVKKACETITTPVAPMALRLQSNLLWAKIPSARDISTLIIHFSYGVARVYSQQCGYVLQDAQTAQSHLRALFKIVRRAELDLDATKSR